MWGQTPLFTNFVPFIFRHIHPKTRMLKERETRDRVEESGSKFNHQRLWPPVTTKIH